MNVMHPSPSFFARVLPPGIVHSLIIELVTHSHLADSQARYCLI